MAMDYEIEINSENLLLPHPGGYGALRYQYREYLAEFMGTLILVLLGDGVVAQVSVNSGAIGSSFLSINLGFAMALMFGIYVAGPVSGAHLNPAVTLANAILRDFPARKIPGYFVSQTLGAFVGAALVYANYWPALNAIDGGHRSTVGPQATAGIFATFPYPDAPIVNSVISETLGTGMLLIGILAITDRRQKIPAYMAPIAIGTVLGSIGMSLGVMTGFALNPARDFGPRLFTAVAGWGWEPFTARSYYFWVPIVAPFIGALVGVFVYDTVICPLDPESEQV
ncbi:glycerol channel [Entomophthora muscae]|uniref:Glycerol channel n=1 Tax=Entomophthora muscae TaxID=34485 RepID=A0ACC2T0W6_9FUNG|nr:glycerol channel [Entomophthora muscae]